MAVLMLNGASLNVGAQDILDEDMADHRYENFIGKHLLVGITFTDEDQTPIDSFQTHGKILLIDATRGIVIEKADGTGRYTLPPDVTQLHPAASGEYRLRTTGEIVSNPDFLSSWTIAITPNADDDKQSHRIELYKRVGYEVP